MFVLRPITIRPRVHVSAKKEDFITPTEAPGEGNRRFPSMDQGPEKKNAPHQKVSHGRFQNRGDRLWKVP